MKLQIDISEWVDEANREEVAFKGIDDLLDQHVKQHWSPMKSGRLAIAARELNRAKGDILPENKLLVNSGAAVAVSQAFSRQSQEVTINGRDWDVRSYVAPIHEDGNVDYERTFVESDTQEAVDRAIMYLDRVVPGYVAGRLAIIAQNGGNVAEAANTLKANIDEIAEKLA